MIVQLALALGLTCVTVVIHASGTLAAITHLAGRWKQDGDKGFLDSEMLIVRVVSILLLLHFAEAAVWAGFFAITGVLPDMETAIYFSITSYTTVGYGDVVLPVSSRVLGPIEAAVGILMFGWSTGIIVTVLTRIYGQRLQISSSRLEANRMPEEAT